MGHLYAAQPQLKLCVVARPVGRGFGPRMHDHPFHELGVVEAGECAWQIESQRLWLHAGQAILVPANVQHGEFCDREGPARARVSWLGFCCDDAGAPEVAAWSAQPLDLGEGVGELAERLRQVERELDGRRLGAAERLDWLLRDALLLLCRALSKRPSEPRASDLSTHQLAVTRAAAHFIRENHANALRINEIARHVGLSHAHFTTLFHRAFGISPQTYLSQVRVEVARRLLAEGDLTLKEIAASTGFGDAPHLCRRFKLETGLTPGQVRTPRPGESL